MSHVQTGTSLEKDSISFGGITSGPAIHERQRELARRRRAELATKNSEAVPTPLFGHPKKVLPSKDDPIQESIKNVLGDPSIVMQSRHQLYGIQRVPATPVDSREGGFIFTGSLQNGKDAGGNGKDAGCNGRSMGEKRPQAEGPTRLPNKPSEKDKLQKGETGDRYSEKGKVVKNDMKSLEEKSLKPVESVKLHKKSAKLAVSPQKSVKSKSSSASENSQEKAKEKSGKVRSDNVNKGQKGAVAVDVKSGKSHSNRKQKPDKDGKHDHSNKNGACDGGECTLDVGEKKKKQGASLCTDGVPKPKPAKLVMPSGISQSGSDGMMVESGTGEMNSVEKILAEMTQPMGPPLTGIKTPIKANHSSFPFPHNGFKECPAVSPLAKPRKSSEPKPAEGNLLTELQITDDDSDDEQATSSSVQQKDTSSKPKPNRAGRQRTSASVSSSSSDSSSSDSESSDSDSDSSDGDTSCPDSPKGSECERSWGLSHIARAAKRTPPSSVAPTTQAGASPPALPIGGDGLRGDEAAPAPNMVDPSDGLSRILFGSCDDLTSSSFGNVSDLLPSFGDGDGDGDTLPFEPPNGERTDSSAQDTLCTPQQNGFLSKEEKTDLAKKGSTSEGKSSHGKKQGAKGPKSSNPKHEMAATKRERPGKDGAAVNGVTSKSKSKAAESIKKKENKKKTEAKAGAIRNGIDKTPGRPAKCDEDEDMFVDVVSDVGNPLLDETGLTDKTKTSTEAKSAKAQKSSSSKMLNGLDGKYHNGEKVDPVAVSPPRRKNGVKDGNVQNGCSKPDSLLVKFPLTLLKRVPKAPKSDQVALKQAVVSPPLENGSVTNSSRISMIKIPKRPSSVDKSGEQPDAKKPKGESKKNSESSNKKESSRKSRERLNSVGSTTSREDGHRKRSPDRDNERSTKKRKGPEGSRGTKVTKDHDTLPGKARDSLNDAGRDESAGRAGKWCSCGGKKGEENKDLLVSTFYDDEPRVQDSPDHHLAAAKQLKHRADSLSDKEAKVHTYVEAIINFVRCGRALEQDKDTETRSAYQMYSETLVLMRYVMRTFLNRGARSEASKDRRLAGLCTRLQALIYLHMFKLKKDQVMAHSKTLTESFCKVRIHLAENVGFCGDTDGFNSSQAPPRGVQAPSPYNPPSNKMTETPSPMSPTPSPSGSVGSTSSNEAVTTPSRNGKFPSGSVTSPVNISVTQKTYTMTSQHLTYTNTLLYSHDCWDSAQDIVLSNKEFFMDLDRRVGPLTLHSSMVHAVKYVEQGLKLLRTSV